MRRRRALFVVVIFALAVLLAATGLVLAGPRRGRCVSIGETEIVDNSPSRAHRRVGDVVGCGADRGIARPRRAGIPARPLFRDPFSAWKPVLNATISATSITLGDSIEVVYSTQGATGAMRDWTQLRPFIGRSDGIVIPLNGSYRHTPTEPGIFVTRLMATNRAVNLNHNGKQEGWRRAVIIEFTVEVRRPGEASLFTGAKSVYQTTRSWWRSERDAWKPRR